MSDIIQSWLRGINPTEEDKERAMKRLEICNGCPHKEESMFSGLYVCGLCHCPLVYNDVPVGKLYSNKSTCPLSKWD